MGTESMIIRDDVEKYVRDFIKKTKPDHRYASFDYCYNYFLKSDKLKEDMEKSCLVLGFYLASWGMYRGGGFLLREKSLKHFEKTIECVSKWKRENPAVWSIDVDSYDDKNIKTIIDIYSEIKTCLIDGKHADLTLVTKVLLGVFGFIPAFDNFFCETFSGIAKETDGKCGFCSVNQDSLNSIKGFYDKKKDIIDKLSMETFTFDFATGEKTTIHYPKAKIIDMYGFNVGFVKAQKAKEEKKRKTND
jgi:hypothetical protein